MPGEVVKRLRDRRLSVWEEAKGLADAAAEENRAFSGEEQGKWDSLNSELDALDRRIRSMLEGEQREADTAAAFDKLAGKPRTAAAAGQGGNMVNEIRAFLQGQRGRSIDIPAPTFAEQRVIMTTATASSGAGQTIPTSFYNRLIEHLIEVSGLLQAGPTVLNTAGGETIQVPKTVLHTIPTAIVAETDAILEIDPTFSQVTLGAYKFGTLHKLSRELIDDSGVDLEGYLARTAGRALGNQLGAYLVTGAAGGTGPIGVLTHASLGKTGLATGGGGAPTASELIDLQYSVISPYRSSPNCGWLMRDATVGAVRKLTDLNGQFLWQPALTVGAPDVLLGKPVYTDPNMPAVVTGGKSILFGDFSTYFVRYAGALRFERSDEVAFTQDLVTFRCLLRADGALVDTSGSLKYYQGAST